MSITSSCGNQESIFPLVTAKTSHTAPVHSLCPELQTPYDPACMVSSCLGCEYVRLINYCWSQLPCVLCHIRSFPWPEMRNALFTNRWKKNCSKHESLVHFYLWIPHLISICLVGGMITSHYIVATSEVSISEYVLAGHHFQLIS